MSSTRSSSLTAAAPKAGGPPKASRARISNTAAFVQNNLLLLIVTFRLLNALTVQTFFQPDEYYQSLEPAWWLAFGESSGAWMTWEWENHLRSALHPALFAVVYKFADSVSTVLSLSPSTQATVQLIAPRVLQAVIAALSDYYTYKLSVQVYGRDTYSSWGTLALTIGSPWQWFVSVRTFSNCIETTLTSIALYNWPFHWALGTDEVGFQVDEKTLRIRQPVAADGRRIQDSELEIDETTRLRQALFCAAFATVLRPTNAIIWLTVTIATFGRGIWHHGIHWEIGAFIREGLLCGSTVLALSALVDRLFYGVWTFPLWHFFQFNVVQSLAVFYGNNNWHYYLSQGYPLLLIAAIIPATVGLYHAVVSRPALSTLSIQSKLTLHRLGLISLVLPTALSVLSHKEVRFIYPILPALHILAAQPLVRMLGYPEVIGKATFRRPGQPNIALRVLSIALVVLIINPLIVLYTSRTHNSGLTKVTDYLRTEFETHYLDQPPNIGHSITHPTQNARNLTFAVLMPCHSIPWRSHLQYPPTTTKNGISGWALTCEPPLNLNSTAKASYLDEADIFYADPILWLKTHMSREIPLGKHKPGVFAQVPDKKLWSNPHPNTGVWLNEGQGGKTIDDSEKKRKRAWPDYLVFFQQLEPVMRNVLEGSRYEECWRSFNSHFHDDQRRKGDVVVWCLEPERTRTMSGSGPKVEREL